MKRTSSEMLMIPDQIKARKGAKKVSDIPQQIRDYLQEGVIESVNLTEWLSVNHFELLQSFCERHSISLELYWDKEELIDKSPMKAIPLVARGWHDVFARMDNEQSILKQLSNHVSDSVRCWAAYVIGLNASLSIEEKFAAIYPFAVDTHFGVREIAWMAVRESISIQLDDSFQLLFNWLRSENEYARRFAIEAIRPIGVWAKHIAALKQHPELALFLLSEVKSDSSKYVQDSVSNWLNDASKSQPEWVRQVCAEWIEISDTKETRRIVKRAMRSIT